MQRSSSVRFVAVGLLISAWPVATPLAEQPKAEHKVVTIRQLFGQPKTTLEAALNRLGKEGWEAMAAGKAGVLLRKTKSAAGWEYRVVKSPDSTLNGRGTDDDVLTVLLESLAAQRWEPCLADLGNEPAIVLKRPLTAAGKAAAATP